MALLNGFGCADELAANRAQAYGDGVFETVLLNDGQPLWLAEHFARLQAGARRLQMHIDMPALRRECDTVMASACGRQVLKIHCYRRSGGRGYQPSNHCADRLLSLWSAPRSDCWQRGARLLLCNTRLASNPELAGIKHGNRLEQVLAAAELANTACDEGLMMDLSGRLVEGTRSNVFLVKSGGLLTPSLQGGGVAGIMRDKVLQYAADHGIACRVTGVGPSALATADEIFLCNSVFGLWPVTAVGCLHKKAGPLCRQLQHHFESLFYV